MWTCKKKKKKNQMVILLPRQREYTWNYVLKSAFNVPLL
jgi:hypothetical protein